MVGANLWEMLFHKQSVMYKDKLTDMVKKGKGSLSKIKPKESELVVSRRFYSGPIPHPSRN